MSKLNNNSQVKNENHDWLDSLPRSMQLIILTLGMCVFFGVHNLLQEAIMKLPNFTFGVMLGYMEVLGVTVGSYLERTFFTVETDRKAPLKAYPLLTLCLLSSSSLSNMSLNYINFPTKVVFRSCKLLPTMLIASVINQRVFSSVEYVLAFSVCLGLIFFTAADMQLTPTFHPFGLLLVSLSVIADSILPNYQEKLFHFGSSRLEVTLYSNFFTLIAMSFSTLISGDMFGLIYFVLDEKRMLFYFGVYTLVSYIAISFFMQIVKKFGAVTGVLAGTTRKAMTLILSFLIFPKEFSWYYVIGTVLILGGLLLSSLYKIKMKDDRKPSVTSNLARRLSIETEKLIQPGLNV